MSSELKDVADAIEEAENPQPSGPILLDSRGAPTRRPISRKGDYITRGQAEQMVMAEREENERMVKWYMQQIPALCARIVTQMMVDMCDANGLMLKGPAAADETPTEQPDAQDGAA